jgi:hypothetical protein
MAGEIPARIRWSVWEFGPDVESTPSTAFRAGSFEKREGRGTRTHVDSLRKERAEGAQFTAWCIKFAGDGQKHDGRVPN